MKVGENKPVNDELCNFHSLYKDKLFGIPLTSNNAKTHDSLNEETFANAKLSGFLLYTEAINNP